MRVGLWTVSSMWMMLTRGIYSTKTVIFVGHGQTVPGTEMGESRPCIGTACFHKLMGRKEKYEDAPLSAVGVDQAVRLSNWVGTKSSGKCFKSGLLDDLYHTILGYVGEVVPSDQSAIASCDENVKKLLRHGLVPWSCSNMQSSILTLLIVMRNQFRLNGGTGALMEHSRASILSGLQDPGEGTGSKLSPEIQPPLEGIDWNTVLKNIPSDKIKSVENFKFDVSQSKGDYNSNFVNVETGFDEFCDWTAGQSSKVVVVVGHPRWLREFYISGARRRDVSLNIVENLLSFSSSEHGVSLGPGSVVKFRLDTESCTFVPAKSQLVFGGVVVDYLKTGNLSRLRENQKSEMRDQIRRREGNPAGWVLEYDKKHPRLIPPVAIRPILPIVQKVIDSLNRPAIKRVIFILSAGGSNEGTLNQLADWVEGENRADAHTPVDCFVDSLDKVYRAIFESDPPANRPMDASACASRAESARADLANKEIPWTTSNMESAIQTGVHALRTQFNTDSQTYSPVHVLSALQEIGLGNTKLAAGQAPNIEWRRVLNTGAPAEPRKLKFGPPVHFFTDMNKGDYNTLLGHKSSSERFVEFCEWAKKQIHSIVVVGHPIWLTKFFQMGRTKQRRQTAVEEALLGGSYRFNLAENLLSFVERGVQVGLAEGSILEFAINTDKCLFEPSTTQLVRGDWSISGRLWVGFTAGGDIKEELKMQFIGEGDPAVPNAVKDEVSIVPEAVDEIPLGVVEI